VKDAVKKSDVELLDALNKVLVPPDLANDEEEGCAMGGIETEEQASAVAGWPEVPLPSAMLRPEMIARTPAGLQLVDCYWLHSSGSSRRTGISKSRQAGKGFKITGERECKRCDKEGGKMQQRAKGWKAWG
jgi:hypothetical protein